MVGLMDKANGTQLVICDNNYLEVEGCKRIMEYNDIYLKLKTASDMIIEVWGSELSLSDYNTGGVAVRGKITSVELAKGSNGKNREDT